MAKLPSHLQKGHRGEQLAADFLVQKGYQLLARNYRFKKAEVDLIVGLGTQTVVFVEVKYRKNSRYGHPESFVGAKKEELLQMAAHHYLEEHPFSVIRFDVVAISETPKLEIFHIEDAF